MNNIDLNKYSDFVEAVTSQASNDFTTFISRLDWIDGDLDNEKFDPKINVSLLLTAALGMAAETGEFCEICRALGLNPNDVIAENVNKLKSRYPGGAFDAHYSEHRKDGDI